MQAIKIPVRVPTTGALKPSVVARSAALTAACDLMIGQGVRPSIDRTIASTGIPRTSLLRKPYRDILDAKRRQFDARHSSRMSATPARKKAKKLDGQETSVLFEPTTCHGTADQQRMAWLEAQLERKDQQIALLAMARTKLLRQLRWNRQRVVELEDELVAVVDHLEEVKKEKKKKGR